MADLNYPDHFYADALNQKPTGAYDAAKLREETIAIAQSQDRADPVTKPAHYQRAGIETIDYIRATLDIGGFEGYCIGNVLKYVSRYREKGGVEDLRKAQVYLGWAISPNRDAQPSDGYDAALSEISEATKPPKWSPEWVAPSAEGLEARVIKQHRVGVDVYTLFAKPSPVYDWKEHRTFGGPSWRDEDPRKQHPMAAEALRDQPGDRL